MENSQDCHILHSLQSIIHHKFENSSHLSQSRISSCRSSSFSFKSSRIWSSAIQRTSRNSLQKGTQCAPRNKDSSIANWWSINPRTCSFRRLHRWTRARRAVPQYSLVKVEGSTPSQSALSATMILESIRENAWILNKKLILSYVFHDSAQTQSSEYNWDVGHCC